jgi:hypothetical protein
MRTQRNLTSPLSLSLAAIVAAGLVAGGPTASFGSAAGGTAERPAARAGSDIALKAYGYGTRVAGGQVPAGSSPTAWTAIACAVKPGLKRHNELADATLPSAGRVSGVKTNLWTRKVGAARHSYSRNSTAQVVLSSNPLGTLRLRGVTSLSHAWHDARGFHAATTTSIGRIEFVPRGGDAQVLDLPAPGDPVTVPGVATIAVGSSAKRVTSTSATAGAVALRVRLIPSGTELFVARTVAEAVSGVRFGRFGGYSAGTQVTAAAGNITSGRNPLSLMPCQGTHGKVAGKDNAHVDLGGGLVADAVSSRQYAQRFPRKSVAWERGSVAGLDLGSGQLVVDAVVGRATVVRKAGGRLLRSIAGSTVGRITANGQPQTFPDTGVLEIPGVARLERNVVTRFRGGLKVVALRVTLLDGQGAVVDLGNAQVRIRR